MRLMASQWTLFSCFCCPRRKRVVNLARSQLLPGSSERQKTLFSCDVPRTHPNFTRLPLGKTNLWYVGWKLAEAMETVQKYGAMIKSLIAAAIE